MTRLLNVATPLTAGAVTAVAPLANVPWLSVSVTVDESVLTVWPAMSCTAPTNGPRGAPAVPTLGCWRYAIFAGGGGSTATLSKRTWPVNALLVAVRNPGNTADAVPRVVRPETVQETGARTVVPGPTPAGP